VEFDDEMSLIDLRDMLKNKVEEIDRVLNNEKTEEWIVDIKIMQLSKVMDITKFN